MVQQENKMEELTDQQTKLVMLSLESWMVH